MLSKNALVTDMDSLLPPDLLFKMVEREYCLERVELWEFLKNCSVLSYEDKKSLLLLVFLTKSKNETCNEPDERILRIWEEIDRRLNLSARNKTKTLCQLVRELPHIWQTPSKKLMRRGIRGCDEAGYVKDGSIEKYKTRHNGPHKVNIYRLDQSFTHIKVTSAVSRNSGEILSMIVDTGANVNVIKADAIDPKIVIILQQRVRLVGLVQNQDAEGLGVCNIPIYHEEKKFLVEFYVINQAKNLAFDGVLGRPFLQEHLVTIDFAKQELLLKADDWTIPFFNQVATFKENCVLKGYSERVVESVVMNANITKGYIPQCELTKGIFISRAVIKHAKNRVTTTIRNVGPMKRVLEPFCLELLPLPKFVEKDWAIVEAEMKGPVYKEMEAKYKDFEECLRKKYVFPSMTVQEFNATQHTPNALFCPMNIDQVHFYSKIVNAVYRTNPVKPPGLHKVTKVHTDTMVTYLCTDRYLYIEQSSTKDTFFTLYNLKEKLVSENFSGEFFILELNRVRMETPRPKLFNMIHYVFDETDIDPIVVIRNIRTPKTEGEKLRVIYQNHVGKKNKHYGYVRTYNKIRDGHLWSTMKEDIMEFMLQCPSCKYNSSQFKALYKILPLKTAQKEEWITQVKNKSVQNEELRIKKKKPTVEEEEDTGESDEEAVEDEYEADLNEYETVLNEYEAVNSDDESYQNEEEETIPMEEETVEIEPEIIQPGKEALQNEEETVQVVEETLPKEEKTVQVEEETLEKEEQHCNID